MATIQGGTSGVVADVDTNKQLQILPATTPANTGYVGLVSRQEAGSAGTVRARAMLGSLQNRLMAGIVASLWEDTFNANALNTALYKFFSSTQTAAAATGLITFNGGGSTTIGSNCALQTNRYFPLYGNGEVRGILKGSILTAFPHVTNNNLEFGFLTATLPGTSAPADGIFFRFNAANELRGVVSYGGTETQTVAITQPSTNVQHEWMIVVGQGIIEFWIDGEFRAGITQVSDTPGFTQFTLQATFPYTIRQYIPTSSPASATKFQFGSIDVISNGIDNARPVNFLKSLYGLCAYQAQNGSAMGTLAQYANNTNPATQVPTNTTAALGSGLGGKFQETLTLAAGTDGIIQNFQNPISTTAISGRNLVITGVSIGGVVTVALTTNPLAGTMSLAFGHTAVSMANAETGSFTSGGQKAPRRIALCTTSVASATAAAGTPVIVAPTNFRFTSPIVVYPGEFLAVTHNKITTAPATGSIMWTVTYDGYFE